MNSSGQKIDSSGVRTWTVLEILQWTATYFHKNSVDSPRLSAELLLCEVLGVERLRLYVDHERLLSPSELKTFRVMIERRVKQREPLQYIIGHTNFFGCNLRVDSRVLIPRPETEQLVHMARERVHQHHLTSMIDIGTGSGCIAIALAKYCPALRVIATDRSEEALELAKLNAELNHLDNIEFVRHDILHDEWQFDKMDLVLSNPPYIAVEEYGELEAELRNHEPKGALTDEGDGLTFYRHFAATLPQMLKSSGWMFAEIGYNAEDSIRTLFGSHECEVHRDMAGHPRVAELRLKHS